jgi:hypothetical protein
VLENLAALLLRKIDVEDNQRGTWRGEGAIRLIEIPHGLFPVSDDVEGHGKLFRLDGFLDQEHVRFVIFDDKNKAPDAGGGLFKRGA